MNLLVRFTLLGLTALSLTGPARAAEPAPVLLLGSFHFDNPGLDAVKFQAIDVLQPAPQRYLQGLAQRLADFKPTRVMLEYPESADEAVNQRYRNHLAGRHSLGLNEVEQIGFRVAQRAGLARVHSVDEQVPSDAYEALFANLPKRDPRLWAGLMAKVQELSARMQQAHSSQSLGQLLREANSPEADRENKSLYMRFNSAGAAQREYLGADSAAAWWQRNLRMYARIQAQAQPGERVLVIAGSGHTAILRDLLRSDAERVEEPVQQYLKD